MNRISICKMHTNYFSWNDFELSEENQIIYKRLKQCIEKRTKYQECSLQTENGSVGPNVYDKFRFTESGLFVLGRDDKEFSISPTIADYYRDSEFVINIINHRPTKSLCFRRLENLKHNFLMYKNLSSEREKQEQKMNSSRDFYRVTKVDTHVHHSACMNSKHLLKFIKQKLLYCPDDVVYEKDGVEYTLKQVFDKINISVQNLCIDTLDTHAHTDSFHRFDRFNAKYNPIGQPILREIFLKYDNYIQGRYLCELTKEVFALHDEAKYIYAEYRISIYGKSQDEWCKLSNWIVKNQLIHPHVKWHIQIPRLYSVFVETGQISSFGEFLRNFFEPLFLVTQNPQSNPTLHKFLLDLAGFDCVDDESMKERRYHKKFPLPNEWCHKENPPFSYYTYFIYANLTSLNHLRKSKGLNTFVFRPHAGETGDPEHLAYTFLTAHAISHGVQLRKSLPLQYLYYLCKIGIAMSPLSNNSLFLTLENNPFPEFFQKGLNISVSTDDPLQFHFTKDPLMEEYSIVTQMWKMSSTDQCELARNSVLQSAFSVECKKEWIGHDYQKNDDKSNTFDKTNVPNMRIKFRYCMWYNEWSIVYYNN